MSKYTTEVRFICEDLAGLEESKGFDDTDDIIEAARPQIFNFEYPIFDAEYKPVLEHKILDHFYTREIGFETYGLWKQKLRAKLREIMPYYNKLYASELIEFNPLYSEDIRVDGQRSSNGSTGGSDISALSGNDVTAKTGTVADAMTGTDTTTKTNKNDVWDLYSDTPQGAVNGILGAEDDPSLGKNGYLTNARHTIGDTTGSSDATTYGRTNTTTNNVYDNTTYGRTDTTTYGKTNSDLTSYYETIKGYRGFNPSKSLMEFRKTFLNIDMMIIKDLEELFFLLW